MMFTRHTRRQNVPPALRSCWQNANQHGCLTTGLVLASVIQLNYLHVMPRRQGILKNLNNFYSFWTRRILYMQQRIIQYIELKFNNAVY